MEGLDMDQALGDKENDGEPPRKYGTQPSLPGLRLGRCTDVVMRTFDCHVCLHISLETMVSPFLAI
jgi:hypothetical protein